MVSGEPPNYDKMGVSNWEYLALKIVDYLSSLPEAEKFCSYKEIDWSRINDYPGIKMSPTDLRTIRHKLCNYLFVVHEQWLDEMFLLFENVILFEKHNDQLRKNATFL
jgi:hypothetical protein